jgi:hypothetical protein
MTALGMLVGAVSEEAGCKNFPGRIAQDFCPAHGGGGEVVLRDVRSFRKCAAGTQLEAF